MKINSSITINGQHYQKGDEIPWYKVYPFFLFHMGVFGGSGFFMAYGVDDIDLAFLYMHGGIAILVYLVFYLTIFGKDEVKWMLINAGLGIVGIYAQIGWVLSLFEKNISDYSLAIHVIPFCYYVLYTFLLHQAVLDLTHSRDNRQREQSTNVFYVVLSLLSYGLVFYFTQSP